jgi:hypothetical protein
MRLKKEYGILAAVIIVLILYLVFQKTDRTNYTLPALPGINKKDITKLQIEKSGSVIDLNKRDNTWYIDPKEYPADTTLVNSMLDVIETLTLTAMVSESKNYVRYDLDERKKIHVKAWAGTTLLREFDIGKTATTYQHTFIKLTGDPNVYHARGYFQKEFDKTMGDLRDRTILSFKKEDIQQVEIFKDGEAIVISRKEVPEDNDKKKEQTETASAAKKKTVVWQTADEKQMDTEKIKGLLSSLSDLNCEKYIEDAKKEAYKDPTLSLKLKGKKEEWISIYKKIEETAKNQPATSSQNAYVFLLSEFQVEDITKTVEEILKPKQD